MDDNKRAAWRPLKGTLLAFLILGLAGISFFFWKYDDVFPAASLDLHVSKSEIASRSRKLSESLGYPTQGCIESTTFGERSEVATFLEHEYSMREANDLMHSKINAFYWFTRFCRPQEEEEFQVMLDPHGKLVAFSHEIEKEKAIPNVSSDKAMLMALKFVEDQAGEKLYTDLPKEINSTDKEKPAQKVEGQKGTGDKESLDKRIESELAGGSDQKKVAESAGPEAGSEDGESASSAPAGLVLKDGIKLIQSGSVKQLNRTDHYFTWEDQSQDFKGAHLRTSVAVAGNTVSSYETELHIPEEFERKFANMRSYNDLLKSISSILFSVVGAGMFFAFVWSVSTGKIRWRLALIAGGVAFGIELLDYWNDWSSIIQSYSTQETSLQAYLYSKVINSLVTSVMTALSAVALIGGVEAVYRTVFPKMTACEHILNWKLWSNRALLETIMAGIFVFGIHIGYVALFYLGGQHLGVWSPLEVRDVATLSSISPAFSSFAVGVNASVTEELMYRVLCFALAQRVFKNFWIANLVQAAGWAFMHSDYPQEPAYARGVELTIVGLFYGYLMRRFGVMAGIISHFIYDAFLGVTPLLLSPNLSLAFSGILACIPPFIALAIGLVLRSRGMDPADNELQNENLPVKEIVVEEEVEERHLSYKPLTVKAKAILLLVCILSSCAFLFLEPRKMGSWARMTVDQAQVKEIARKFLRDRGVEEGDWKVSALLNFNMDADEIQYGFEKEGYKKTEEIMKAARLPLLWWVRFYKPNQRREYDIAVSAEGRPVALQIKEEEEAAGENITQAQARKLTEEFLSRYRPEFAPLKFESVLEQKKKNRTDCSVSYEVPRFKMGDARLKISIDTVGSFVSFPHVTWDIPDKWKFERDKQTLKDNVAGAAAKIILVVCGIFAAWWAVGLFRSQSIHWRAAVIAGLFVTLLSFLVEVNGLPAQFIEYDTDVPFLSFLLQLGIKSLVSVISTAAIYVVLFAAGHGAFRLLCPGVTLSSLWHSALRPPKERLHETKVLWSDGVLCAFAWIITLNAIAVINNYFEGIFSPDVLVQPLNGLVNMTQYFSPAVHEILNALIIGVGTLCVAPIAVGIYMKYFRNFWQYFACALMFLLVFTSVRKYWQDYVVEIVTGIVEIIAVYFWIRHCGKNNPVAYFLIGALNSITVTLLFLFHFAGQVYTVDLWVMLAFWLLPLLIALLLNTRRTINDGSNSAGKLSGQS